MREFVARALLVACLLPGAAGAATVTLVPGAGFNDATPATPEGGNSGVTLGEQRTILFNAAAAAWGAALGSNQEIKISAQFTALTCGPSSGVLGSAGATNFFALNDGGGDRWFPVALAEALTASNLNGGSAEISANFNSTIDLNDTNCLGTSRWYYGLVGPAPAGTIALYPTVLHEIGHGLGFAAFVCRTAAGCDTNPGVPPNPDTAFGGYFFGIADAWSDFMRDNNVDGAGTNEFWITMTDAERATSFTHDPLLVWDGANVNGRLAAFGQDGTELNEGRMRMYAPAGFQPGSSVSHFHEDANPNLLMEPIADADVFRQTDLTDCLFEDIGWVNPRCDDTAPTLNAIANPPAINEDAGTQTVNLSGIAAGAGAVQTLSIAAVSGNLALIPNPTVNYTSPNATGSLQYAPLANQSGTALVLATVTDSAGSSLPRTFTVTVNPVNDAPSASNLSAAQTYIEDTALDLVDIVTGDVDHANLSVTLTLSNPAAGSLNTGTSGAVTSTYNPGSGVWNANGAIANVNVLLAALTFTPTANFNANFSIATSVSDGVAPAVSGNKAITGTPVEDPPSATNLSAAESFTEDLPLNLVNIVASDADSANLTATLTLSTPAAGALTTATSGAVTSTYTPGTGVWSASGALANVNALLAGVSYVPATHFASNFSIATSVGDGTQSVTGSKTMTATPVNDPPGATNLSSGETYTEDTPRNLVDIVVSDVDGGTLSVTLTLSSPSAGGLNTATSGSVSSTYTAATGVWNASGAIADVNTLLAGLVFTPAQDFNANFAIATSVSDGVALAVTGSKPMTGTAVNDAATATNLSAADPYTEDTPLDLTDIVASDIDSANVSATLTMSNPAAGSLNTATSGSVTSTFDPGSGVWNASGAISSVNTLLANLTFAPAAHFNATFTLNTSVSDGAAPAVTGIKVLAGTAVNDAPTAINASAPETFVEDTPLNLLDLSVADVDSSTLSVTLTLSQPAAGSLATGTAGAVTSTYVPATGAWNASGPIADVNALLAALVFSPASQFAASFSIATSVSDGVAPAVTGSKPMTGTPVNDAPGASNLSAPEVYVENSPLNLVDIVVGDIDDSALAVTLTMSDPGAGTLSTATSGSVTSSFASGVWTASGAIADLNVLLANLVFTPAPDSIVSFTLATQVSDGEASPLTGSKAISGIEASTPPQATNLSAPETYVEDTTLDLIDIVVTDADSPNVSASLVLSNPALGAFDTATVGSTTSTYVAATGTWQASGPIAEVNALLASVGFQPADDVSSGGTVATQVQDESNPPLTGSKLIAGLPVNDAPTLDAIVDPPLLPVGAGQQTLGLSGIGAGALESSQSLTLTASSSNPALLPDPLVEYASPAGTGLLRFQPVAAQQGTAVVTVTLQDNGGTLGGGVDTTQRSFSVTVLPTLIFGNGFEGN